MSSREVFAAFLKESLPCNPENLLARFDEYLERLFDLNKRVNLVSRKMGKDSYWLHHFLDSLLVIKCIGLNGQKVLDFGTGGGLPGIPLKLAFPGLKVVLLDSVGKKVKCLQEIIAAMNLADCQPVWNRLEDYAKHGVRGRFDYIFCRSVRMEPIYREPFRKLLKDSGKVIFYKAHLTDDLADLTGTAIYDVSRADIGKRQIIIASRSSFTNEIN